MLCLGPKKSLSPKLKLTAQGMAQFIDDQSQVWYHSAIQAPPFFQKVDNKECSNEIADDWSRTKVLWRR